MRRSLLFGAFAAVLIGSAANAGTPYRQELTCPLDGQKFSFTNTMSYSTFGAMLDGMPMGSWIMPMPIPQCPGSNFPLFQETFSDAELATARALVAEPAYQAMKDESSYYVLRYVLARMMPDREPIDDAWLLLSATWQAQDEPDRYARYVAETISVLDQASDTLRQEKPDDWIYVQTILANLSRQSGDFAAAGARLDALPSSVENTEMTRRIRLTRDLIVRQDKTPQSLPRDVEADEPKP